ncbi:hypothetical protein [Streptomyces sp. OR43]|uniref:hypothetical protein n=1 Tax=Streptomyces sp. or43 TaxID=2478957 RepID=UPI0011CD7848|nr:hypothetical protein [Streptomyces sp. or43]
MNNADYLINAGLLYGPGLLLAAGTAGAWRTGWWIRDRHQARIDKQTYTARAARLNRVADRADAFLAMPEDLVTARLEAHYAATPNHAREEGR